MTKWFKWWWHCSMKKKMRFMLEFTWGEDWAGKITELGHEHTHTHSGTDRLWRGVSENNRTARDERVECVSTGEIYSTKYTKNISPSSRWAAPFYTHTHTRASKRERKRNDWWRKFKCVRVCVHLDEPSAAWSYTNFWNAVGSFNQLLSMFSLSVDVVILRHLRVASTKVDKSQVLIELLAKSINQATWRTLQFKVKMLKCYCNCIINRSFKEGSE